MRMRLPVCSLPWQSGLKPKRKGQREPE